MYSSQEFMKARPLLRSPENSVGVDGFMRLLSFDRVYTGVDPATGTSCTDGGREYSGDACADTIGWSLSSSLSQIFFTVSLRNSLVDVIWPNLSSNNSNRSVASLASGPGPIAFVVMSGKDTRGSSELALLLSAKVLAEKREMVTSVGVRCRTGRVFFC
jgi:hypothetical protein